MHEIILTFDLEDWFQVRNMRHAISRDAWDRCEIRFNNGLQFILEELDKRNLHSTFFVLGWLAERFPEMVKSLALAGHETASHGYSHRGLDELSSDEFAHELKITSRTISAITGKPVLGFRAPSFSVTQRTAWALKVLRENQILYDSSIYPIRHPNYGIAGFGESIRDMDGVVEVPLTTATMGRFQVPVSGGGYFRLYPYSMTRTLLRQVLQKRHAVIYFHPWEFDAEQPRNYELSYLSRFRHYTGLRANREKFRRLLNDFSFVSMEVFLRQRRFIWN